MKKLEDITYRHELIERYLDADTSVEEEQALAEFYRHCEDKDLTDEDLDIRNLMLGMENYTPNFHQTEMEMMEELDGKEEMKELDRKEEADGQLQMKEMSLAASKTTKQDGYASLRYFLLQRCWQDSSSCSSLSRIISHPLLNNNLALPT